MNSIMIISKTNIATNRDIFSDIDILEYEIETENVYDNFDKNKEMFDFSNYSAQSKHYNDLNALVVGKIKDGIGDAAF